MLYIIVSSESYHDMGYPFDEVAFMERLRHIIIHKQTLFYLLACTFNQPHAVSCGLPELPTAANDTVVDVDSTHEGSTVTFLCADGEETLSIKCMRNGSWTPEPSEINCSVFSCKVC